MKREFPQVTEAELAVLEKLWESGPLTTRQIQEQLYPRGTRSDLSTVHKLLERLESKGCITRDRSTFAHVITARLSRTQFAGLQLEQMAEKLSDGSLAPLVIHLVQSKKLTKREREAIRKLLENEK